MRARCTPVSSRSGELVHHSTRFRDTPAGVEPLAEREVLLGQLGVAADVAFRLGQQRTRFQPPEVERGNAGPPRLPLVDDSVGLGEVVSGSAFDEKLDQASPGHPTKTRLPLAMCSENEARRASIASSGCPL